MLFLNLCNQFKFQFNFIQSNKINSNAFAFQCYWPDLKHFIWRHGGICTAKIWKTFQKLKICGCHPEQHNMVSMALLVHLVDVQKFIERPDGTLSTIFKTVFHQKMRSHTICCSSTQAHKKKMCVNRVRINCKCLKVLKLLRFLQLVQPLNIFSWHSL